MIKKNTIFFITLVFILEIISSIAYATIDTKSFFQNILSMYKWNIYLPALDLLEKHKDTSYKCELFKAIGYQRTNQLGKALISYKKALSLNPKANNIKKRLKLLQAKVEIKKDKHSLNSPIEKANYLLQLSKSVIDKQPDLAFRYFIQAYEYNTNLDANDDGIISEGIIFYKANMKNKHRFPKLFHAIFLQMQGDNHVANLRLNEVLYRKDMPKHLKELAQRFLQKGKEIEAARKIAFERVNTEKLKKLRKKNNQSKNNRIVEAKINNKQIQTSSMNNIQLPKAGDSPYRKLSEVSPNSPYAQHMQKETDELMEKLENNPDEGEKRAIIRALGNTHSQDPAVMAKLLFMLDTPKLEEVNHILESIVKIGEPSARTALPYLLPLIQKDNKKTRFWVMEALGKLSINPQKVVPALYNEYKTTSTSNEKHLIYKYISSFGSKALPVLRTMLSNKTGPNKRPVAQIISQMTGRNIEDILNE